jgi:hypothetical protein
MKTRSLLQIGIVDSDGLHEQELIDGCRAGTWKAGLPHLSPDTRSLFQNKIGTLTVKHYSVQFCTFSLRKRRNSFSLFVTRIKPAASACAAIHRSLFPIISPFNSSSARIVP